MRWIDKCRFFTQLLLPQACALCGAASREDLLCAPCNADLPRLSPDACCGVCGLPVTGGRLCGACLADPPHYDDVIAAFAYAFPVDALVQRLKYRGDLSLAPVLGRSIARLALPRADVIVPMPLAAARARSRGFNQSLEIARAVHDATGIALATDLCRRVADTAPQAALPWADRARNVRGAFACDTSLEGLHVAVVDDVMTTGATLNELARVLKSTGARRVSGWMAARTLRD